MAEKSAIAWTDSTFNPWIGCTKISPGCDHCYAAALDAKRFSKTLDGGTKDIPILHWGPGVPRHRTSASNWKQPLTWNRKAKESGKPWRVFCSSLADVFDNEVPDEWRRDLWDLIEETPYLSWLLVTKRIGNAAQMLRNHDWAASTRWNVRILITVVNQEEADRDIPKLLALSCKNGVSYEPALGPVDFAAIPRIDHEHPHPHPRQYDIADLEWIIVGGESAQGGLSARPFNVEWALSTIAQCTAAGVPVFVKQLGARPIFHDGPGRTSEGLKDRAGADPAEWPEDLRVQEFPA